MPLSKNWINGFSYKIRRLTDRLIPDDVVFLFIFKAWNPRIASYVRASATQKRGKKTSSGGMRLFGNRLKQHSIVARDIKSLHHDYLAHNDTGEPPWSVPLVLNAIP